MRALYFINPAIKKEKGQLPNLCMGSKKSSNYLDNQNRPFQTTAEFIGPIFVILNKVKNNSQLINNIVKETKSKLSVILNTNETNICYKIDSAALRSIQFQKIRSKLRKQNQNNVNDHHRHIQ